MGLTSLAEELFVFSDANQCTYFNYEQGSDSHCKKSSVNRNMRLSNLSVVSAFHSIYVFSVINFHLESPVGSLCFLVVAFLLHTSSWRPQSQKCVFSFLFKYTIETLIEFRLAFLLHSSNLILSCSRVYLLTNSFCTNRHVFFCLSDTFKAAVHIKERLKRSSADRFI